MLLTCPSPTWRKVPKATGREGDETLLKGSTNEKKLKWFMEFYLLLHPIYRS